jgi:nifR3 family TIM-barrel protein
LPFAFGLCSNRGVLIGSLQLNGNLFLSPLAGYTNLAFRLVVRQLGGVALATTDLVNARSLLERNRKAIKLIETSPADSPLAVQLFGAVPGEMRDAALMLQSVGVAAVDINMGCPVRKVCRVGGGSAMMTELDKTARLVRGMVEAVKIPVTAKMRLGWDDKNITAPELARVIEDSGVSAVFVHGRTRAQGFGGAVNLAGIAAVVRAVRRIPVIGNGDVTSPLAARVMLDQTGCAGLSIGRGALYHPWIFRDIEHFLKTGQTPPEPQFEERLSVMRRHLESMINVFGETNGCRQFRKVGPWYAKRFGPASLFTKRIVNLSTLAEFDALLEDFRIWRRQFLDEHGHLKPRFHPRPITPSFMPLPKGPVETW